MARHEFHLQADWNGGWAGTGNMALGNLKSKISVPAAMKGAGEGTNPDEMLVGAAASCYLMTLAIGLEGENVKVQYMSISSTGTAIDEGGLHFESIVHKPRIVLPSSAGNDTMDKVRSIVKKSEERCMVSKALNGNVKVTVEAAIETK